MKIKLLHSGPLLSHDLDVTEEFYKTCLGLDPVKRESERLHYESGLVFLQVSPWVVYIGEKEHRITRGNRTPEIVYNTEDFSQLHKKHEEEARIIVSKRLDENQNQFYRIYDPDNHIIEVREKRD